MRFVLILLKFLILHSLYAVSDDSLSNEMFVQRRPALIKGILESSKTCAEQLDGLKKRKDNINYLEARQEQVISDRANSRIEAVKHNPTLCQLTQQLQAAEDDRNAQLLFCDMMSEEKKKILHAREQLTLQKIVCEELKVVDIGGIRNVSNDHDTLFNLAGYGSLTIDRDENAAPDILGDGFAFIENTEKIKKIMWFREENAPPLNLLFSHVGYTIFQGILGSGFCRDLSNTEFSVFKGFAGKLSLFLECFKGGVLDYRSFKIAFEDFFNDSFARKMPENILPGDIDPLEGLVFESQELREKSFDQSNYLFVSTDSGPSMKDNNVMLIEISPIMDLQHKLLEVILNAPVATSINLISTHCRENAFVYFTTNATIPSNFSAITSEDDVRHEMIRSMFDAYKAAQEVFEKSKKHT